MTLWTVPSQLVQAQLSEYLRNYVANTAQSMHICLEFESMAITVERSLWCSGAYIHEGRHLQGGTKGPRSSSNAFKSVPPVNTSHLVRGMLCLFVQRHVGPMPREGGAALSLFHRAAAAKLISPH